MGRRVIVCGGRDYTDRKRLESVLNGLQLGAHDLLIQGGARGADTFANEWAKRRGVPRAEFPANWTGEGRAAGGLRNQRMLDVAMPDLVVAFPGGPGTRDMVRRARRARLKVIEVPNFTSGASFDNEDLI